MGWFDDFVSNTVSSVADVVSNTGKSIGISEPLQNAGLAGTGSNAAALAAVAAAGYGAYSYYTAADSAAYTAAAADAAAKGSGAVSFGIPEAPAIVGTALPPLSASVAGSASLWSTTKEVAGVAKDVLSTAGTVLTIKNAMSGKVMQIPSTEPIPSGWQRIPDYSEGLAAGLGLTPNTAAKQQALLTETGSGADISAAGIAVIGAAVLMLYKWRNKS